MAFVSTKTQVGIGATVLVYGPVPNGKYGSMTINVCTDSDDPVDVAVYISDASSAAGALVNDRIETKAQVSANQPLKLTGEAVRAGEYIYVKASTAPLFVRVAGPLSSDA